MPGSFETKGAIKEIDKAGYALLADDAEGGTELPLESARFFNPPAPPGASDSSLM